VGDVELVAVTNIAARFPRWPFSYWSTMGLIRAGKLRCVKLGRRHFVTDEILRDFIAAHTTNADAATARAHG
jgi:hypothetical protein